MRGKNRKPIASCLNLPQFTTMNVIDGQAGLILYTSLIFYSLTIDNILNIIVLLILAGVSISMLTGENGILKRAPEAKEKTEIATEEEQNTLLQYEYEMAKMQGEISETETFGEYSMEKEIKEKYGQDIKIGDTVNYNDGVVDYDGKWKVLGIENGQILLMSSKPVKTNFQLHGREGYLNGVEKLDKVCEEYGAERGAESARSLRVEDINRITGYSPERTGDGKKFAYGDVNEYGSEVTYTKNSNGKITYNCSNGLSGESINNKFYKLDGTELTSGSITLINSYYLYYVTTLTDKNNGGKYNDERWKNLFSECPPSDCWLR